jgi:hypothetical protein
MKTAASLTALRIESYIVRIYRRRPGRGRLLIGVVERPGGDRRSAFSSLDELWRILTASRAAPHGRISTRRKGQWERQPRS